MNVPTPEEAYFRSPGFCLASATNSFIDLTGRSLLTTATIGAVARIATGVKALIVS